MLGSKFTCVVLVWDLATVTVWGGSTLGCRLDMSDFCSSIRTRSESMCSSLTGAMCTIFLGSCETLDAISVSFLDPTERNFLELRRTDVVVDLFDLSCGELTEEAELDVW